MVIFRFKDKIQQETGISTLNSTMVIFRSGACTILKPLSLFFKFHYGYIQIYLEAIACTTMCFFKFHYGYIQM